MVEGVRKNLKVVYERGSGARKRRGARAARERNIGRGMFSIKRAG